MYLGMDWHRVPTVVLPVPPCTPSCDTKSHVQIRTLLQPSEHTHTEFTRGWFGFWFKSESCRNLNLTLRARVELFRTHALSHDHEVLQVPIPGEGLRRRFYLN